VRASRRLLRANPAPDENIKNRLSGCLDATGQPDLEWVDGTGGETCGSNLRLWQGADTERCVSRANGPESGRARHPQAIGG
jgi:hypothetical protein